MTNIEESRFNRSKEANFQSKNAAEQFEYWKHFESAGGTDKNRMVTIVTWLLAFGAAILGYILKETIIFKKFFSIGLEAIVPGTIGVFISILSIYVVRMFSNYANQNWKVAEEFEGCIPDLQNVLNNIKNRHRASDGMAPVFKVFLGMSIGMLILFCAIITISTATQH